MALTPWLSAGRAVNESDADRGDWQRQEANRAPLDLQGRMENTRKGMGTYPLSGRAQAAYSTSMDWNVHWINSSGETHPFGGALFSSTLVRLAIDAARVDGIGATGQSSRIHTHRGRPDGLRICAFSGSSTVLASPSPPGSQGRILPRWAVHGAATDSMGERR